MGFPCNQFFNQEKRPDSEIKEYVQDLFDVKFQLFSKVLVNGNDCHPIFKFLRKNSSLDQGEKGIKEIPWNFAKFLVDRNGKVIDFFAPTVTPEKLASKIEGLLKD
jgi:glutathione peroxidase